MKVSPGEIIGQSAESLDKPFLHTGFALCMCIITSSEEPCQVLTWLACSFRGISDSEGDVEVAGLLESWVAPTLSSAMKGDWAVSVLD